MSRMQISYPSIVEPDAMPARKPTEQLLANGAHLVHPERFRDRGLIASRLEALPPKAPAHLAADIAACWLELRAAAAPGVLALSDAAMLETAARLLAELRRGGEMAAARMTVMLQALRELGYSPVSRTRIAMPLRPARPAPDAQGERPNPGLYFS